ncbi:DNA methylase [anaerobic digester metagenome]|uniref:site-specific DNA-methyltransferase n=1 Tax=Oscillibacter sp. GMB15532 TaxID=3230022 RepID=UPI0034DE3467
MAAIKDLLQQITDPMLRERLTEEVTRISKNKKFGLVFEEHVPECTPLYGVPIRCDSTVARKTGKLNQIYIVKKIDGKTAVCEDKVSSEITTIPLCDLVAVAQFGDPIFPSLEPIAKVENAPNDSLWHTIIEADNYHALQLLEYLYEGQVDCIYIDPPYNTGARDWKYNNDYVDSADAWRHSKWLSMMKKRLRLAKRILNPNTGVLIVTIDEHEVHHLRTMLEDIFPEFFVQMITAVTNPKGVTQGRFSRVEEYAIFCFAKNAFVADSKDNLLNIPNPNRKPRWKGLLRSGTDALRTDRESMFYPVLIDAEKQMIIRAGHYLPISQNPVLGDKIDGYDVAWPIRRDGSYGRWSVGSETLNDLIKKGYVACGKFDMQRETWGISYISQPNQLQIERGGIRIVARNPITGVVEIEYVNDDTRVIKTVWHRTTHDAGAYGSDMVSALIGQSRAFSFPKSLYSTKDAISAVMKNKPTALIVDFFAGSGTTLHAVNLLNAEDNGKRRCILVTNNEVSEAEAQLLTERGYQPGDPEWEKHGICRSVTWPRTEYSILGKRADGTVLSGEYFTNQTTTKEVNRSFYQMGFVESPASLTPAAKKQIVALIGKDKLPQSLVKADSRFIVSEKHTASVLFDPDAADEWLNALEDREHITDFYIVPKDSRTYNNIRQKVVDLLGTVTVTEPLKRPMSEGFAANAEYFKLGFLDKNSVSLGQQFAEILPLLWLKAGAIGKRPELDSAELPNMLILPQNSFAVLLDEDCYGKFAEALLETKNIGTVYFVTNSEEAFREMSDGIGIEQTYQLYRDYIDNFVIGSRRNNL